MSPIDTYLDAHREAFVGQLCEFLRIPSVSADPQRRPDMAAAAQWVLQQFLKLGLRAEVVETEGHSLVYAESAGVAGAPTALVYGHYDVQPPDPLDLWETPPFEPTIRNGNVYARGATDDKGQMLTHIKGAEAWLKTAGRLPLKLKFLIEGEEEVGSQSLQAFIRAQAERLKCDVVVISDGAQFAPGLPSICYGLRGIAYFELRIKGPNRDLHSGTFGGSIMNPGNALAKILAELVDSEGRVQLPGFYDDVVPLTAEERSQFARLPFVDRDYARQIGVESVFGEAGFTTLERRWARPTCDINGLFGGYQGEGAKTVLPASAGAKFSFRLVPNQDPAKVGASLREFVARLCPAGVTWELIDFHGCPGVLIPLDRPCLKSAARAIEHAFGRAPVYAREGGSIPVVSTFHQVLGADTLLVGWGQDDDNTHSPNEKFSLDDFQRGIRASARLWEELSRVKLG